MLVLSPGFLKTDAPLIQVQRSILFFNNCAPFEPHLTFISVTLKKKKKKRIVSRRFVHKHYKHEKNGRDPDG